jgi:hypothetical protein
MILSVLIDRDGRPYGLNAQISGSRRLFATPRAYQKLLQMMMKNSCICLRCYLICRQDELDNDTICIQGSGCRADVDQKLISPSTREEAIEAGQLIGDLWSTFLNCLPRRADGHHAPPDDEEQYGADGQRPFKF